MKIVAFFLLFALVNCQTVSDDLMEAQNELTIGHEFGELFLVQNRQLLSDYLTTIETRVLASFMDAYASIKVRGIETRELMDEYEQSFCKDNIRNRWELQVVRYGQKLSQCLGLTNGYLVQFTTILNALHHESRAYTNMIPNASVNVLSHINIFTGRDNLRTYISNAYRDLIFRALDWHGEFEDFISEISIDLDDIINQLTACFRSYPILFDTESRQDLEAIRLCYGD